MKGYLAKKEAKTLATVLVAIVLLASLASGLVQASGEPSDLMANDIDANNQDNAQDSLPSLVANYDPTAKQIYDFFSAIGSALGISSDSFVNATIGMLMLLIIFTAILAVATVGVRKRKVKRKQKEQAKTEDPQPTKIEQVETVTTPTVKPAEIPPTDIKPEVQPTPASKLANGGTPALPSALNLQAQWTEGKVTLTWETPQINAKGYRLDGYLISAVQYGPMSISPVKAPIAHLPVNATQWSEAFTQTYRWNSRGDTDGYIVEAIVRYTSKSGFKGILRIGAIIYAP